MKQFTMTIMTSFIMIFSAYGQDYKKMNVFVTDNFDSKASLTVQSLNRDPLIATDALKNALVMNGFKVISEKVAKEKIELNNQGQESGSSFNQDITIGKTTYIKSVYVVTLSYQYRPDTGCGGSVISNLSGQIVDLTNDGQIVATFSFKQGNLESKCTSDVMNSLAKKVKEQSNNR